MYHAQVVTPPEQPREFRRWWFKLENSINSEKVFATLPNETLGVFVRMLAVANAAEPTPGMIDGDISELAFTIRVEPTALASMLDELETRGLIVRDENGIEIRKAAVYFEGAGLTYSSSREGNRERQARFQAKKKSAAVSEEPTNGYASRGRTEQTRVDKSTEDKTTEENSSPGRKEICSSDPYSESMELLSYPLPLHPDIPLT